MEMRIGDRVFVRIAHMYAEGVITRVEKTEYVVKVGDREFWVPQIDCTSLDALEKWGVEPTTR